MTLFLFFPKTHLIGSLWYHDYCKLLPWNVILCCDSMTYVKQTGCFVHTILHFTALSHHVMFGEEVRVGYKAEHVCCKPNPLAILQRHLFKYICKSLYISREVGRAKAEEKKPSLEICAHYKKLHLYLRTQNQSVPHPAACNLSSCITRWIKAGLCSHVSKGWDRLQNTACLFLSWGQRRTTIVHFRSKLSLSSPHTHFCPHTAAPSPFFIFTG